MPLEKGSAGLKCGSTALPYKHADSISGAASAQTGFIRVSEGQFVDDNCDPFYFSGYNTWQVGSVYHVPTHLSPVAYLEVSLRHSATTATD